MSQPRNGPRAHTTHWPPLVLLLVTALGPAGSLDAGAADPQPQRAGPEQDTIRQPATDTFPERIPTYQEIEGYLQSLRPVRQPRAEEAGPGLNLDLVVNETRTPTGQDFFDEFYAAWEPPEGVSTYTIRIQEQPVLGLYTRVVLLLNGEQLFQLPLQPRHEYIRSVAQKAANYVRNRLKDRVGAGSEEAVTGGGPGSDRR